MDGLKRYLSFGKRINGDDGEVTVVPSCVTKNCFGHRLPALHMNAITTTRQKGGRIDEEVRHSRLRGL